MALNIDIYNSSYFLELDDSTIYGIHYEGANSLGVPSVQRIYQEVWGKGYAPPSAVDYGNRQASLEIMLKGTSLDNLIVNYRQLEIILLQAQEYWATKGVSGDRAFLSIQLAGMTNPIEYEILDGILGAGGIFQYIIKNTSAPKLAKIPLSLTLRPWGRPQALTRVASGSLNNGGGTGATGGTYSMAAPVGDVPAPVKVSFAVDTGNYRYLLARRTVGNVANFATLWPIQCEVSGGTGYTVTSIETSGNLTLADVAVAGASGGNVNRLTHAATGTDTNVPLLRFTINDNLSDIRGRFRVFLRVDAGANSGSGETLHLRYGRIDEGFPIVLSAVAMNRTNSADALFDMGEIMIPAYASPQDAVQTSFIFDLYGTFTSAVFTIDLDCIYLMPVDEEILDVRFTTLTTANDIIIADHLAITPSIYQTDSTGVIVSNNQTVFRNTRFHAGQGNVNLWLPLVMRGTGSSDAAEQHILAHTLTLTFDYPPQYALLR